jgi:hypothetical protein
MNLSNDVIAKRWVFRSQIDQSWNFHAKSNELKQKQKREIVDKIKRKKKKEKKSTNRYSSKHRSTHVFNWTRHWTRGKQTWLIDKIVIRRSTVDCRYRWDTWWNIWRDLWSLMIKFLIESLFSIWEKKSWCYHLMQCYDESMNISDDDVVDSFIFLSRSQDYLCMLSIQEEGALESPCSALNRTTVAA